jgi:butyrate kinase
VKNENVILVINPGSTSTKVAIYKGREEFDERTLYHTAEQLSSYNSINEQFGFRQAAVRAYLDERNIPLESLSAIAARGGVIGQLESGAYLINPPLVEASKNSPAPHASNLAAIIAYELALEAGINAYIYDAVCGCGVPDEIFTITGFPEIKKKFLTHVLNSRAVAIEQAENSGRKLSEMRYIVAHMGGGITVNLLVNGKIMDFVGDDEGTFSPERAGGIPSRALVKLCYSGKYSEKEMQHKMKGAGGVFAYLGTNDMRKVEQMLANNDAKADMVCRAMTMQIAKDIGSLCTVVSGKVDGIILTGGLAYQQSIVDSITERVSFLAPVSVIPGTREMKALAWGIHRVITGEEPAKEYIRVKAFNSQ